MTYDFNKIIDRRNTRSLKWEKEDMLPLWVADMDFQAPPEVIEALMKRAEHGIFGYPGSCSSSFQSIKSWMERRFSWQVEEDWINFCPGTIPALSMLVRTFTHPGDRIILQAPNYPPFLNITRDNGCHAVYNQLQFKQGKYHMDFADLEQKIKEPRVKLLILCSPHNPVGRVWEKEELARLAEICLDNNVLVVSDELHADLVYKGCQHIPLPLVSDGIAQNTIVLSGPTKTFNLAGLQTSFSIIPNPQIRSRFKTALEVSGYSRPNVFGLEAVHSAYDYGEPWLESLIIYIRDNLDFLTEYLNNKIPILKVIQPEGTYLAWIDCRELKMETQELEKFFLSAGVFLNQGYAFGPGGAGFIRLNLACPRSTLEEALQRIERAIISRLNL
ncbi:MAG: pyridoxal phosphate-dependent aminotransferase [Dethiobacter sp.]|jgi:cystathionine beta-lyase|nr:pyridoxal phosphate-dependent aminotransferase [Dethiobacter sp.]